MISLRIQFVVQDSKDRVELAVSCSHGRRSARTGTLYGVIERHGGSRLGVPLEIKRFEIEVDPHTDRTILDCKSMLRCMITGYTKGMCKTITVS